MVIDYREIHIFIDIYREILFHFFHYMLLQDIKYSSLCYTVGSPCLSVLYIVVCISQGWGSLVGWHLCGHTESAMTEAT